MSGTAEELFDVETEATETEPAVIVVRIRMRPGAGVTKITGRDGNALGVRCATPHTMARSSIECVTLLATVLGIESSAIVVISGESGREKRFRISVEDVEDARRRIDTAIDEAVGRGRRTGR
jgi:uncharacterized protein YggU (UPF0235/DUF167 family)